MKEEFNVLSDKYTVLVDDQLSYIKPHGLENRSKITKIQFDNCTKLDEYACMSCISLKEAVLPKCQTLGSNAFNNCVYLSYISLPNCITIQERAFISCCSLTTVSFEHCTNIKDFAFFHCSKIKNTYFPVCESIGSSAFAYNNSLSNVTFPKCTTIETSCFYECAGLETISFPVTTNIQSGAFYHCINFKNFLLPRCTTIENNTFKRCTSLQEALLPKCTYIGDEAFYDCVNLQTIYLPNYTSFNSKAFNTYQNVINLTIPSITDQILFLFSNNKIEYLELFLQEHIKKSYFSGFTKLTTISCPICTNIEECAFSNFNLLQNINFSKCTNIPSNAFYNCQNVISISFPHCINIVDNAFYNCQKLQSIKLPECKNIIGGFNGGQSLKNIYLPKCERLDSKAFNDCFSLSYINTSFQSIIKYSDYSTQTEIENAFEETKKYYEQEYPYYTYIKNNNEIIFTIYSNMYIPNCTSIGKECFCNCSNLLSISFPKCTIMYDKAFYNCQKLDNVHISSCEEIGSMAFYSCYSIYSFSFDNCKKIHTSAFANCINITQLTSNEFSKCSAISEFAFDNCVNLSYINIPALQTIGKFAFNNCINLEKVECKNVWEINDFAFNSCATIHESSQTGLKKVSFPNINYKTITEGTFRNCNFLYNINIPYGETLGSQAFYNCSSISYINKYSVDIFDYNKHSEEYETIEIMYEEIKKDCEENYPVYNLSKIDESKIQRTIISNLYIPNCKYIEEQCFYGCNSLLDVTLTECKKIDKNSFENCSKLKYISIPECTYIGDEAFKNCVELEEVYAPLCSEIGLNTFINCPNLKTINLGVISLSNQFTEHNKLESVIMNYIITIPSQAFAKCKSLKYVQADNCNTIEKEAFDRCYSLEQAYFSSCQTIKESVFKHNKKLSNVHIENCQNIGSDAFYSCGNIKELHLSNGKKIYNNAFYNCSKLSLITTPLVTNIHNNAFRQCISLKEVELPECKEIDEMAFYNCDSLEKISAPKCTTIKHYAFGKCENLISVYAPSCNIIETEVFSECVKLPNITLMVSTITSKAFMNCLKLSSGTFTNCTRIENQAFERCVELQSIIINNTSYIGTKAFYDCEKLEVIDKDLSECTNIEEMAFYNCQNIKSLSLDKIATIKNKTFYNCISLEKINTPVLETVQKEGLYNCISLQELNAPYCTNIEISGCGNCEGLSKISLMQYSDGNINDEAFNNCTSLIDISIPHCVSLGKKAFYHCTSLPSITTYLSNINVETFAECTNLSNAKLYNCKNILSSAFYNCSSLDIINADKCQYVGNQAFENNGIINVSLPRCSYIGKQAYKNNLKMKTAYFPRCLNVDDQAFYNCTQLSSVKFNTPENKVYTYTFTKPLSSGSYFTLPWKYRVNKSELLVTYNRVIVDITKYNEIGEEYSESNIITFTFDCLEGDEIFIWYIAHDIMNIGYTTTIENNFKSQEIELPFTYTVGKNELIVTYNGTIIDPSKYTETGVYNTESNKITLHLEYTDEKYLHNVDKTIDVYVWYVESYITNKVYTQSLKGIIDKENVVSLPWNYTVGHNELLVVYNGIVVDTTKYTEIGDENAESNEITLSFDCIPESKGAEEFDIFVWKVDNIFSYSQTFTFINKVEKNTIIELPFYYIVGKNELFVSYNGIVVDTTKYNEIGEYETESNEITLSFDCLENSDLYVWRINNTNNTSYFHTFKENFIADTVITLPFNYKVGSNELMITYNGVIIDSAKYTEIYDKEIYDNTYIQLDFGYKQEDEMYVHNINSPYKEYNIILDSMLLQNTKIILPWTIDNNSLIVIYNGSIVSSDKYSIISNNSISLLFDCSIKDEISVIRINKFVDTVIEFSSIYTSETVIELPFEYNVSNKELIVIYNGTVVDTEKYIELGTGKSNKISLTFNCNIDDRLYIINTNSINSDYCYKLISDNPVLLPWTKTNIKTLLVSYNGIVVDSNKYNLSYKLNKGNPVFSNQIKLSFDCERGSDLYVWDVINTENLSHYIEYGNKVFYQGDKIKLPWNYTVGQNELIIKYKTDVEISKLQYNEVGGKGSKSNKIQLQFDFDKNSVLYTLFTDKKNMIYMYKFNNDCENVYINLPWKYTINKNNLLVFYDGIRVSSNLYEESNSKILLKFKCDKNSLLYIVNIENNNLLYDYTFIEDIDAPELSLPWENVISDNLLVFYNGINISKDLYTINKNIIQLQFKCNKDLQLQIINTKNNIFQSYLYILNDDTQTIELPFEYIVGNNNLLVFYDGIDVTPDYYNEIGGVGGSSNELSLNFECDKNSEICIYNTNNKIDYVSYRLPVYDEIIKEGTIITIPWDYIVDRNELWITYNDVPLQHFQYNEIGQSGEVSNTISFNFDCLSHTYIHIHSTVLTHTTSRYHKIKFDDVLTIGTPIKLPWEYTVGGNEIKITYRTDVVLDITQYNEIGELAESSNEITLNFDCDANSEITVDKNELEYIHTFNDIVLPANTLITLPWYYTVGNNELMVTYNGVNVDSTKFKEIGNISLESNQIKLNFDCKANSDVYIWKISNNIKFKLHIGKQAFYNCSSLSIFSSPIIQTIDSEAFYNCRNLSQIILSNCYSINNKAFYDCWNLLSLSLSKCFSIGEYTFGECKNLRSVYLPQCSTIPSGAFYNCKMLYDAQINPTNIEKYAFYNTSIPYISLSLSYIGTMAFAGCSYLSTVNIPTSINIENSCFYNCSSLHTVLLSNVNYIPNNAFENCINLTTIDITNTKSIQEKAFYNCNKLFNIHPLNYCTEIQSNAFENCSNITKIDANVCSVVYSEAFKNCILLSSVVLPHCQEIHQNTFYNCKQLKNINIKNCTTINCSAFMGCKELLSIDASNCNFIGTHAFYGCNKLQHITFPLCKNIKHFTYQNCYEMSYVYFPEVSFIDYGAFKYCLHLENGYFPKCSIIGSYAFYRCYNIYDEKEYGIKFIDDTSTDNTLYFPQVYKIEKHAFEDCKRLIKISLYNCKHIANNAFENCINLTKIILPNCTKLENDVFKNCTSLKSVSINTFVSEAFVNTPIKYLSFNNSIITSNLLKPYSSTISKIINNNLSNIPSSCFIGFLQLSHVILPNCTVINENAFNNTGITEILSEHLPICNIIYSNAFMNCCSLSNINFWCNEIYDEGFRNCSSLKTVTINTLENKNLILYSKAFADCSNLYKVIIPLCTNIGSYAFDNCSSLINIQLSNCKYINKYAFNKCKKLNYIELPECSYIGNKAFNDCSNLSSIYLPNKNVFCSLFDPNVFNGTQITSSTGNIYVTSEMYEKYKLDGNWRIYNKIISVKE